MNIFLFNYPSPDDLDSLGSRHTAWDLEGLHKAVRAVGLGIFILPFNITICMQPSNSHPGVVLFHLVPAFSQGMIQRVTFTFIRLSLSSAGVHSDSTMMPTKGGFLFDLICAGVQGCRCSHINYADKGGFFSFTMQYSRVLKVCENTDCVFGRN